MKLLDRIKQAIEAGQNDYWLFHGTGLTAAVDLLKNDRFKLTPTEMNRSEVETMGGRIKKAYGLSTARTLNSGFLAHRPNLGVNQNVFIVIDRRKLERKRNLNIIPVEYGMVSSPKEAEERVLYPSRWLKGVVDCIVEIRLFLSDEFVNGRGSEEVRKKQIRDILIKAQQRRIKVKLFKKGKSGKPTGAFLLGREKKEERKELIGWIKNIENPDTPFERTEYDRKRDMWQKETHKKEMKIIWDLHKFKVTDDINKQPKPIRDLMYGFGGLDYKSLRDAPMLSPFFANARMTDYELSRVMKANKVKTIGALFDTFDAKFEKHSKLKQEKDRRERLQFSFSRFLDKCEMVMKNEFGDYVPYGLEEGDASKFLDRYEQSDFEENLDVIMQDDQFDNKSRYEKVLKFFDSDNLSELKYSVVEYYNRNNKSKVTASRAMGLRKRVALKTS